MTDIAAFLTFFLYIFVRLVHRPSIGTYDIIQIGMRYNLSEICFLPEACFASIGD